MNSFNDDHVISLFFAMILLLTLIKSTFSNKEQAVLLIVA